MHRAPPAPLRAGLTVLAAPRAPVPSSLPSPPGNKRVPRRDGERGELLPAGFFTSLPTGPQGRTSRFLLRTD